MKYNIENHIHTYSSWAASRAASVKNNRFTVEKGQLILSKSDIKTFINNPDKLPLAQNFDVAHLKWRNQLIELSSDVLTKPFTHGLASKMINIYLKTIIICGGHYKHPKSVAIHPPIDSVLLKKLASINFNGSAKFWRRSNKIAWSNFDSEQYQEVIDEIRSGLKGQALWRIEEYWQGHQ